jgi:Zn finger protein HypA/HybF involved in hydrogenase expression
MNDNFKYKVYSVIVSKTVGQIWEVQANSEKEARENYYNGVMVKESDFGTSAEHVEILYDLLECLWCGEQMTIVEDKLWCEDCDIKTTIKEQKYEWKWREIINE